MERRKRELAAELILCGDSIKGEEDEYGRPKNREAEIAGRRRARRAKHRAVETKDGWDTSDASDEDGEQAFRRDRVKAVRAWQKQIFGDVSEDFGTVIGVLTPFARLKHQWKEGYLRAFIHLSLEEVLTSHIQMEMCRWDPLSLADSDELEHSHSLESFPWYNDVIDFSSADDDPDAELIPSLVKKIVYPRVENLIQLWDCASATSTRRVVDLVGECQMFADEDDQRLAKLYGAICDRLIVFCKELIRFPSQRLGQYSGTATQKRLLLRSVKILKCLTMWEEVLSEAYMKILVLETVMQPALKDMKTHAYPQAVDIVEQMAGFIPKKWFSQGALPELGLAKEVMRTGMSQDPGLMFRGTEVLKKFRMA